MTSFRRSFIYVDFFMSKKKKKDKRRNTVAEGETTDLKDVFNSINDDAHYPSVTNLYSCLNIQDESPSRLKPTLNLGDGNKIKEHACEEKNNNSTDEKSLQNMAYINYEKSENSAEQHIKNTSLKKDRLRLDLKNSVNSDGSSKALPLNKKKSKSNIPISTVSAAMNVAVEMRQLNVSKPDQSSNNYSSCNSGRKSFDSAISSRPKNERGNSENFSHQEETSICKHFRIYKHRLKEKNKDSSTFCEEISIKSFAQRKENEDLSSSSSENYGQGNGVFVTKSSESDSSDTFFINSDESDEENYSNVADLQEKYELSTSLSTISGGSLNSLLSQTGTEMTSSTGTLTSVGQEQLPSPVMSLKLTENCGTDQTTTNSVLVNNRKSIKQISNQEKSVTKHITKKSKTSNKHSKSITKELNDAERNATENSKSIFAALINRKTRTKEHKSKSKDYKNDKLNKTDIQPIFDVYGSHSPKNSKQIPAFIKENISPGWESTPKRHMQSFYPQRNKNDSDTGSKVSPNILPPQSHSSQISQYSEDRTTFMRQNVREVPLKYVHQVTVSPIKRNSVIETKSSNFSHNQLRKNVQVRSYDSDYECQSRRPNTFCHNGTSSEGHISPYQYPLLSIEQHGKLKTAAHVVLDPDGRVIYSTNSLDRNYRTTPNHILNKSCEPYSNFSGENYYSAPPFNCTQRKSSETSPNTESPDTNLEKNVFCNNAHVLSPSPTSNKENVPIMREFYPICNVFPRSSTYIQPVNSNKKQMRSYSTSEELEKPDTCSTPQAPQKCIQPHSNKKENDTLYFHDHPPDPNISGLPPSDSIQCNTNRHKYVEKRNIPSHSLNNVRNNALLSPQVNVSCINQNLDKSNQSTISTDDLFAVIYKCKKRMNIKTDSDISPSSPSPSSSTSSNTCLTPVKGNLVETGFLSPRNISGDRKSWADFRPMNGTTTERRYLVNDRLGPMKPTSMHDFKMLLLQARCSSQNSRLRKSAVEMLKVPLSQNDVIHTKRLSLNLSPRNSFSPSHNNYAATDMCFYYDHSTVPFKRGSRAFASLHPRYAVYPPIFEDGSEDTENCCNLQQNNSL